MPIIGAFMGGETSTVAAGSTEVDIVFTTEDGRNLNGSVVSFTGGPETYNVTLGSTGRATVTVASGYSYTAKITPSGGNYSNLNDQSFFAESMGKIQVSFIGLIVSDTLTATFNVPLNMAYARATLETTSPSGIVSSRTLTGNSTVISVTEIGDYSYTLTYLGASVSGTFMLDRSGSTVVDLTSNFVNLTITLSSILTSIGLTPTVSDVPTTEAGSPAAVIKGGKYTVSATGTIPKYSNGSVILNVNSVSVTPTSDTSVSVGASSNVVIISSSISKFTVPMSKTYNVKCFGGGGGSRNGQNSGGGGGGGHMAESNLSLTKGTSYEITIGAGGAAATYEGGNGGATSFGTLLSANGGSGAYSSGGSGGSGGGGAGDGGSKGGAGSYGGGGGSGGGYYTYNDSSRASSGGDGGTYGGGGGVGGMPYSSNRGGSGKNGAYSGGTASAYGSGGGGYSAAGNSGSSSSAGNGGKGQDTTALALEFTGHGSAGYGASHQISGYGDGGSGGGGGYGGNGGSGGYGNREYATSSDYRYSGGGGGGGGGYGASGGAGASYVDWGGGGGGGGGYGAPGDSGNGLYGGGGGGYSYSGRGGSGLYASGGTKNVKGGDGVVVIKVVL